MTWLADLAELWSGGQIDTCEHHFVHDTIDVDVDYFGTFTVFDWAAYANTEGYCTGDDDFSKSLNVNRVWERPGSKIVVDLFDSGNPSMKIQDGVGRTYVSPEVVLDFGSHVGWYSLLAAKCGYAALAVDADPEHLELLEVNAARLGFPGEVVTCRGWIGPDTPVAPLPPDGERVRLVKADIEGNEQHVVRILEPLIDARLIDALLLEISPVFADHYPDTAMRIVDAGYSAAVVPGAPNEPLEPIPDDAVRDYIAGIEQLDFLFTLKDGAG